MMWKKKKTFRVQCFFQFHQQNFNMQITACSLYVMHVCKLKETISSSFLKYDT